ncbi:MAG TPA: hypothetical protein VHE34_29355 [Puia sp.]|uniref:hypothetical protein n=1 Tax=Puia sp. TaxID=2045100 RepID=UPI002BF61C46|nr:hypothetical protein [Puia sp.]HVU99378.1 hypothetical protein [Puia sp.]
MIVLQVAGIGTFVHESTHGVQFDAGGMAFRKDRKGVFGEDIFDEVEAYRSQYSFEPDSLIGPPFPPEQLIFKRIDTAWVRRLESRNGRIYSCGGSANVAQVRLTIYSGWEEIREGYHCDSELDRKYPPGYKPTNDSTLYYNAQNRRVAPR